VTIATTADELWAAVETFDAEAAEIAIARLLWDVPLSGAVTRVVLPFLQGAPFVLLACPPGERHDMVLLCVALMLRERGVRARFLGADTPVPAILTAARGARLARGRADTCRDRGAAAAGRPRPGGRGARRCADHAHQSLVKR
jgi:hypothetical protein